MIKKAIIIIFILATVGLYLEFYSNRPRIDINEYEYLGR